jgi:hypothetical protein
MFCFLLRVKNVHRILYASWNSCEHTMEQSDDISISYSCQTDCTDILLGDDDRFGVVKATDPNGGQPHCVCATY